MMPGGTELFVILAIVVLLFGAKKIPDLAKGIGKGIKDFKKEMKDDETEIAENKQINKDSNTQTTETTKQA
jgi:sec-independent protein translocase protein TatA